MNIKKTNLDKSMMKCPRSDKNSHNAPTRGFAPSAPLHLARVLPY